MSGRRLLEQEKYLAPALLVPVVAYVVLLVGFPFVMAFVYSVSNVTVGNPDFKLVGMRNFVEVVQDRTFQISLMNTCIFTFVSIVLVLILSNFLLSVIRVTPSS